MHLLTVFAHPVAGSYPAAVLDAFETPFHEAGHSVDRLDLDREGFDPRFTEADHAHFWGGPCPPAIARIQERVTKADRLAFVFPVYWWGMPALMKGWIERVFTGGWAYQFGAGVADRGKGAKSALLGNVPTLLIGIAGSKAATYRKYGYADAMRTQIDVGTFAYCGICDVRSHLIYDVEGNHNADNRRAGLHDVVRLSRAFLDPDRPVRDAKQDHLARMAAARPGAPEPRTA